MLEVRYLGNFTRKQDRQKIRLLLMVVIVMY